MQKKSGLRTVLAAPVYDAIKERIMNGTFTPGDRLNIDALAAELDVSPTPVRESLTRLAAEKLATFEPFKGYAVMPLLTPGQFADLMHVRHLLEEDAARLAATRINMPDLLALEETLAEIQELPPSSTIQGYLPFNQIDKKFHALIFSSAGNPFLQETYESLNIHVQLVRFYNEVGKTDQQATLSEHQAICAALRSRDPDTSALEVRTHLNNVEERIYHLMAAYNRVPIH
jgi:DNA-binding GntR family transcriptional regulator